MECLQRSGKSTCTFAEVECALVAASAGTEADARGCVAVEAEELGVYNIARKESIAAEEL